MGLILDTGILIESERRRESVEDILRRVRALRGEIDIARRFALANACELLLGPVHPLATPELSVDLYQHGTECIAESPKRKRVM